MPRQQATRLDNRFFHSLLDYESRQKPMKSGVVMG